MRGSTSCKAEARDGAPWLPYLAALGLGSLVAIGIGAGWLLWPRARSTDPGPRPGHSIVNELGIAMIHVPPGAFAMGTPGAAPSSDEPPHAVRITTGFWLAATEVTQDQWRTLMGTTPWRGQPCTQRGSDIAATHVCWSDAVAFCSRLTERERAAGRLPAGTVYCLPTEAEWERACRAASSAAYCCGDDASALPGYAVYADARDGAFAHAVQTRRPNDWGFFDMHGNVWEWCADAAHDRGAAVPDTSMSTDTYRDGIADPLGHAGPERVCRGGGWGFSARYLRSANRFSLDLHERNAMVGFRLALAARAEAR